jgi:hypothetical protein
MVEEQWRRLVSLLKRQLVVLIWQGVVCSGAGEVQMESTRHQRCGI